MEKSIIVPLDEKGRIPLVIAQWIATDVQSAGYVFKDETVVISFEGDTQPPQSSQTFIEALVENKGRGGIKTLRNVLYGERNALSEG